MEDELRELVMLEEMLAAELEADKREAAVTTMQVGTIGPRVDIIVYKLMCRVYNAVYNKSKSCVSCRLQCHVPCRV